jgi:hypothetical protein
MYPIKTDISDVFMAFPASVSDMMPAMKDIPEKYRHGHTPANVFVAKWFFTGLKNPKFYPREGVNAEAAFKHISCILGSFEPKHEHKDAAVAFLLDEWFEKYESEE